ncbi:MAG: hypothetical protein E7626_02960 [Ruminococcaceae bacterium]|nr:hypothetical protein [Oscillospiraceae bacterium]
MAETIYTIPINEEFEARIESADCSCPLCNLYKKLENDELSLILGASMMEPDVRIKTNRLGFCPHHYGKMLTNGKRLPLALMLESHLNELRDTVSSASPEKAAKRITELENSCYVCSRVEENFRHLVSNAVYMWETDGEFREKFSKQSYFCINHIAALLDCGKSEMTKKVFKEFAPAVREKMDEILSSLCDDVSWFCKKYDYRYENEPWGNAKDSPERSIKFLGGETK